MPGPNFRGSFVYAVPSTSGNYAPDALTGGNAEQGLLASDKNNGISPPILGVTVVASALPAGATVELWLLTPDSDPTSLSSYFLAVANAVSAVNTLFVQALTSWPGALIRVKSGGTSGNATVNYCAD